MLHDLARGMDGRALRPRRADRATARRGRAGAAGRQRRAVALRAAQPVRRAVRAAQRARRGRDSGTARSWTSSAASRSSSTRRCPSLRPSPDLLERLLVARLAADRSPASPVTRLTLELRGEQVVAGQQLGLFAPQLARAARLDWQLTGLALRFGADRLLRARIVDPEATVPEQRIEWSPATAEPMSARLCRMTRLLGHHPLIHVELDGVGLPCRPAMGRRQRRQSRCATSGGSRRRGGAGRSVATTTSWPATAARAGLPRPRRRDLAPRARLRLSAGHMDRGTTRHKSSAPGETGAE